MPYYAWISPEANRRFGHSVWSTPSGQTINVTEVNEGVDELAVMPISVWPDMIFLGEVIQFLHTVKQAHQEFEYPDNSDLGFDPPDLENWES